MKDMPKKWKWDKLFAKAKKEYSKEDLEQVLKLHFQASLMKHIEQEMFEYDIIKEHDYRTIGFFSFLSTWVVCGIYDEVKKMIEYKEDKFRQLSAWDIMTYNKIKELNKKRDKINGEFNRQEFELISGIDVTKAKGYNEKDKKVHKGKKK